MKITLFIIIFLLALGVGTVVFNAVPQVSNKEENNRQLKGVEELRASMLAYLKTGSAFYTENDVHTCVDILTRYIKEMEMASSREDAMLVVKSTVLRLNKLNEQCDYELIETEEREKIAEIMMLATSAKGYSSPEEDVTEQWRDW